MENFIVAIVHYLNFILTPTNVTNKNVQYNSLNEQIATIGATITSDGHALVTAHKRYGHYEGTIQPLQMLTTKPIIYK